ncbi:MAG: T9SS type A sorting domain-containing protein [Bacteroidetes bacterium]|nr:T9SS type A sorting domain-containing protein [Bacteroidota bacterium]
MNRANLYDSINPELLNPPSDTEKIKIWLYHKWFDSEDHAWAWKPENSINQKWPLEENLGYTNEAIRTAGIGGFPLGDLYHWWPAEYQQWKMQEEAENDTINKWLHYGFNYAVGVNEHPYIPGEFKLEQNYPNPFNAVTIIKYNVGTHSCVSVKVYDILGREIVTLVNEVKNAGAYTVEWNGRSSAGQQIGSGVYFYRLKVNNVVLTKKLVLLK